MCGRPLASIRCLLGAAALAVLLTVLVGAPAAALPTTNLWISEVMYNPTGGDDGAEWVELYNAGGTPIDLSSYSLGWGGADLTSNLLQLSGVILPGDYFVVGGPTSSGANGNPSYDQVSNFGPDLENPFLASDGIGLFGVPAASVTPGTLPIHAVIYGGIFGNLFGLPDESGPGGDVDVGFAGAGESLEFDGTTWSVQAAPTPGAGPLVPVPEATPALLMLLGLAGLASQGSRRAR